MRFSGRGVVFGINQNTMFNCIRFSRPFFSTMIIFWGKCNNKLIRGVGAVLYYAPDYLPPSALQSQGLRTGDNQGSNSICRHFEKSVVSDPELRTPKNGQPAEIARKRRSTARLLTTTRVLHARRFRAIRVRPGSPAHMLTAKFVEPAARSPNAERLRTPDPRSAS